jgi:alanyl-tRNA synthetase
MTSHEIRRAFLDFFASKQHKIVPSAPLVLKNDPTLMFTNSGMVQFKDYFLGNGTPPSVRIADTQKCLRVSGKHNDLEDVGFDGTHHTMFEMLGNWSFGDYFKKEAIEWSWELLTDRLGLPKDRLYATVFGGDEKEGLASDEEARNFWRQYLPDNHILNGSKKDNFWEMGAQGPCGPCSEIHFDFRSDEERAKVAGELLVNQDDPSVVEIWNNVFMQFERKADGSLVVLPAQHVDTGMGFERLCMVLQGKRFTYDTDIFTPFIQFIEKESGKTYTGSYERTAKTDVAMRVVADHIRAVAFTIADGQLPASGGAGYVIRRILRRAVRYAYSFLDIKEPFFNKLVPLLATEFATVFPELKAQEAFVQKVILEEEKSFLRTLELGLKRFDTLISPTPALPKGEGGSPTPTLPKGEGGSPTPTLPKGEGVSAEGNFPPLGGLRGADAFELYDTYGFPIDLTQLIAAEKGFSVDTEGFDAALKEQKLRSKKDAEKQVGDWISPPRSPQRGDDNSTPLGESEGAVEFVGYTQLKVENAYVQKYRAVQDKKGLAYQIVLNRTPFYAESGGQVGDTGWLYFSPPQSPQRGEVAHYTDSLPFGEGWGGASSLPFGEGWGGAEKIEVIDTKKENDLIIHIVAELPENINNPRVRAQVDRTKRQATSQNHSATHLMHAALHQILGKTATQKGQSVDANRLRFDFQNSGAVSKAELAKIESIVNAKITENIALKEENLPIEEAQKSGAMMLFGEKYGETVRVITFDDDFSKELCGGTHVQATGEIGLFKIVAESAVAAGVRRIEALTGKAAMDYLNAELAELNAVRETLKTSKDLAKRVEALQDDIKALQKENEALKLEKAADLQKTLRSEFVKVSTLRGDGRGAEVNLLVKLLSIGDANAIKTLSANLEKEVGSAVIVFGSVNGDKPMLTIRISEDIVKSKNLNAGTMVRELAKEIKGGGGGQPVFATAGGTDTEGLAKALARVNEFLN